jgi:hypothetical protein
VASRFTTTEVLPSKTPKAEPSGIGKSPLNSTGGGGAVGLAMKKMGFSQRSAAETEDDDDEDEEDGGEDGEEEGEDDLDIKSSDLIVSAFCL